MREKIFMYLFFFMLLMSIFIYVNAEKTVIGKDAEINKLQEELEACQNLKK
jgi:hypothetical protein